MEKHHDSGTTDRITQDRITLPSGWVSREFIEKRLEREVHQEELSVSDDCTSLAQYLEKFTLPGQCIMDEKGLEEAGYDVLRGMSREKCKGHFCKRRFQSLVFCAKIGKEFI